MDVGEFSDTMVPYRNSADLFKKLQNAKPDLIQGLEPYYGYSRLRIPLKVLPILWTTYRYCQKTKTPYFFHVLENIRPVKKYGLVAGLIMRGIARTYAKGARFIFYLNEGARHNLAELGVNKKKMRWGLWGIWGANSDIFYPARTSPDIKNLLFVGRLIEMKGIEDLIEAMRDVKKELPGVLLTIVGTGPLLESMQMKIKQLNLERNIEFAGEAPSAKMAEVYRRALVFISPSRSARYSAEQIGMVNIEAMMSGLVVISTRTGSIAEFVDDQKTGILVEQKNPPELAKAILNVCEDKSLRKKLSENARKTALEKYDAKKNVEALEQVVLEMYRRAPMLRR